MIKTFSPYDQIFFLYLFFIPAAQMAMTQRHVHLRKEQLRCAKGEATIPEHQVKTFTFKL